MIPAGLTSLLSLKPPWENTGAPNPTGLTYRVSTFSLGVASSLSQLTLFKMNKFTFSHLMAAISLLKTFSKPPTNTPLFPPQTPNKTPPNHSRHTSPTGA